MFGLIQLPWWGYILAVLGLTQVTIFAVTLYLHRCQAHRALQLHPIISHFFRCWLWLTTGMNTKEWAAVHRKHHARVETKEDPHSPQVKGIKTILLNGVELYSAEAVNKETLERFGQGTPDDWIERKLYSRYPLLGITILAIVDLVLFGTMGITVWALQIVWIPFFAAGVINGVGHFAGYRNYESPDASRNILPWGLFLGGEELHNNHHAFATSAKFSAKWWELDIGWYMIRLLQLFGLAKPKRTVPKIHLQPSKSVIDTDTIKAVIHYRLQVMSNYRRDVMMPLLRSEHKRASKASKQLLKRAKKLLSRDISSMPSWQMQSLIAVLDNFNSLRVVYQLRTRLQEIWGKSTASQKELIEALQDWCKQAETSGIDALRRFADRLKMLEPTM